MAQAIRTTELTPFSFMALMAAEGQIPHTTSASADKKILAVAVDSKVREVASDLVAEGDFFSLMVENNQMLPEPKARPFNFKIVRPVSLGGSFPAHFDGRAIA